MRRFSLFARCGLFFSVMILAITTTGAAHAQQRTIPATARVALTGHLVPALAHVAPLGPLAADFPLHLTVGLRMRNEAALDALLAAQNTPTSPLYERFLTTDQFTAQFSPLPATVAGVTDLLRAQGWQIDAVAPNRLTITISGTHAQAQASFGVHLAEYALGGRTVFAPQDEPLVPVALQAAVVGINGLDDVFDSHPLGQVQATGGHFGNGPGGGYNPYDFRAAYDMNGLYHLGFDGTGVPIGVFEQSDYKVADVQHFRAVNHLSAATISNVYVNTTASAMTTTGAVEDNLDLDAISGVAPGSILTVYEGPTDPVGGGFSNFTDIWQQMINDNTTRVLATAWGDCEPHFTSAELTTLDNIFKQGAAQGQTVFAASGDEGPYDCQFTDKTISVDYPASDPYVVGVGGTSLYLNSDSTYHNETAWSCPYCNLPPARPYGLATGGGYSSFFDRPAYQQGRGVNLSARRQVPDVAADADGATGFSVYCTSANAGCSGWFYEGGTSGSAPLWAGMAALIDQHLARLGVPGYIINNPMLYTLFKGPTPAPSFHDITSGNNLLYKAGAGYDLATGVGTPDVWNIARNATGLTYQKFTSQDTSPITVSMAYMNSTLFVAWSGSGNQYINLMHSTDGGLTFNSATKYTSPEKSAVPVSLVAINGTLYAAWTSAADNHINVMHSTDGGLTFDGTTKITLNETSNLSVSLVDDNGALAVAWVNAANGHIMLMRSTDGGHSFDETTRVTSPETSTNPLSTATVAGVIYVAWTGTGNYRLNLMHSTDGGLTFDSATKYVSFETSPVTISMANSNGVLNVAWTGTGNGYLNVMHSTDNNQTFDSGVKAVLFSDDSPAPVTLAFNGTALAISWVGTGNNRINLLHPVVPSLLTY